MDYYKNYFPLQLGISFTMVEHSIIFVSQLSYLP